MFHVKHYGAILEENLFHVKQILKVSCPSDRKPFRKRHLNDISKLHPLRIAAIRNMLMLNMLCRIIV